MPCVEIFVTDVLTVRTLVEFAKQTLNQTWPLKQQMLRVTTVELLQHDFFTPWDYVSNTDTPSLSFSTFLGLPKMMMIMSPQINTVRELLIL